MKLLTYLLLFALSSCASIDYPKSPSEWVIAEVRQHTVCMSLYLAYPIDHKNLNASDTWLMDSVDRFEVGDTVRFYKR